MLNVVFSHFVRADGLSCQAGVTNNMGSLRFPQDAGVVPVGSSSYLTGTGQ